MEQKKLRIGFFIDSFYPSLDGVVNVVDNYARILTQKYGADVTIFAPYGRKEYDDSVFPYKVVRCTKKLALGFLDYDLPLPSMDSDFKEEIKNSNFDIIHIHSPFSIGSAGVSYAKKRKIPVVATMHSQFKKDFFEATKSQMLSAMMLSNIMSVFNMCDECWAVNEMTSNLFVEYGAKKKPVVMLNGTDFDVSKFKIDQYDINGEYGFLKTDKVLLFVGRLVDLKNIDFAIRAFSYIKKEHSSGYKLLIVGRGTEEQKLKALTKKLCLEQDIIFTGIMTDRQKLAAIYHRADIFVFPSFYDTDGIVKKEAAAYGLPTVVVNGSLTSSDIVDNVNGYISQNDEKDFANRIIDALNSASYNDVCINAQKTLYITWEKTVDCAYQRYLEVIKDYKEKALNKKTKAYNTYNAQDVDLVDKKLSLMINKIETAKRKKTKHFADIRKMVKNEQKKNQVAEMREKSKKERLENTYKRAERFTTSKMKIKK